MTTMTRLGLRSVSVAENLALTANLISTMRRVMSKDPSDDDGRIFATRERREAFWKEFNELINRYEEVVNFDQALDGEIDEEGKLYDPQSPKYLQGAVIILSTRNLDDWESFCVLDPREQSSYFTRGLVARANDVQ